MCLIVRVKAKIRYDVCVYVVCSESTCVMAVDGDFNMALLVTWEARV